MTCTRQAVSVISLEKTGFPASSLPFSNRQIYRSRSFGVSSFFSISTRCIWFRSSHPSISMFRYVMHTSRLASSSARRAFSRLTAVKYALSRFPQPQLSPSTTRPEIPMLIFFSRFFRLSPVRICRSSSRMADRVISVKFCSTVVSFSSSRFRSGTLSNPVMMQSPGIRIPSFSASRARPAAI